MIAGAILAENRRENGAMWRMSEKGLRVGNSYRNAKTFLHHHAPPHAARHPHSRPENHRIVSVVNSYNHREFSSQFPATAWGIFHNSNLSERRAVVRAISAQPALAVLGIRKTQDEGCILTDPIIARILCA